MRRVEIYDTTLRDGTQGVGISLSLSDKLIIVRALSALGIPVIEAGNPTSNPKDAELFQQLEKENVGAEISAFGSTRRKYARAEEDAALKALIDAHTPTVAIFGKTPLSHVHEVIGAEAEENLAMIADSVSFLKAQGKRVIYDAEHFFDAWEENKEYALLTLKHALNAGADVLCLCDTRGGSYMSDIYNITGEVKRAFPNADIGIHCHNDGGLAVANSLVAVDAGAMHVQGTYLGYGERCGNANLSTIIPDLQLKRGIECIPDACMEFLTPTARKIADITNMHLASSTPYVGRNAFAHKGGMHIDAEKKMKSAFEHIRPTTVGNKSKFILSEMSGKAALLSRVQEIDPSFDKNSPKLDELLAKMKEMEYRGYQYEGARESFELLFRRVMGIQKEYFRLEHFKVLDEHPSVEAEYPSTAVVKVRVGDATEIAAGEGAGPLNALDVAMRRALIRFYPTLATVKLTDFKVRVLETDATTAAPVRVLFESSDEIHHWTTVGVSTDVIEASFVALADSIEYKLMLDGVNAVD